MPFNDTNLFKPIEVSVDPWSIVTGYKPTTTTGTTVAATITTACADDILRKPFGHAYIPEVKEVIFAPPATIVYWRDGSRTVVKCDENDEYNEEIGFALCFMKKVLQNAGYKYNFNTYIRKHTKSAKRYYQEEIPDTVCDDIVGAVVKKIKNVLKETL